MSIVKSFTSATTSLPPTGEGFSALLPLLVTFSPRSLNRKYFTTGISPVHAGIAYSPARSLVISLPINNLVYSVAGQQPTLFHWVFYSTCPLSALFALHAWVKTNKLFTMRVWCCFLNRTSYLLMVWFAPVLRQLRLRIYGATKKDTPRLKAVV